MLRTSLLSDVTSFNRFLSIHSVPVNTLDTVGYVMTTQYSSTSPVLASARA